MKFRHLAAIGVIAIVVLLAGLVGTSSATTAPSPIAVNPNGNTYGCVAVAAAGARMGKYIDATGPYIALSVAQAACANNPSTEDGTPVRWVPFQR